MCETRRLVPAKVLETVVLRGFRSVRVPRVFGVKLRLRLRPRSSRRASCSARVVPRSQPRAARSTSTAGRSGRASWAAACRVPPRGRRVCGGTPFDRHRRSGNAPLRGGSGCDWKLEAERGALPGDRLDPDLAVHGVDQLATDVEAEPGSTDALRHVRIEAVELLENPLLLARRNPRPLVADGEANHAVVAAEADLDLPCP